ncbi:MAG: membrane protein insertion efficiency factor YidD [Alphaproteobacteria bacterium]|nr:membrane protein insertion efficiency factor YidD [Alphaproteobacteria bacterium]
MITKFFILIIRGYQIFISPLFGGRYRCRFFPRCSDYSIEVLKNFGIVKGSYLTIKRILRCNPFFNGGYDPPPKKDNERK